MKTRGIGKPLVILLFFVGSFLLLPTSVSSINPIPNPELSSAPDRLDPVANVTWTVETEANHLRGMYVSEDGYVYMAGAYFNFQEGISLIKLMKADALGNILWTKNGEYSIYGGIYNLAASSERIYTIGLPSESDGTEMLVNGWDANGNWLWSTPLSCYGGAIEYQDIEVDSAGAAYVSAISIDTNDSIIYKVSSNGVSLWNCTLSGATGDFPELILGSDNSVTMLIGNYACDIDPQGNSVSDTDLQDDIVPAVPEQIILTSLGNDGDLLGYYWPEVSKNITKFDSSGAILWTTKIQSSNLGDGLSDIVNILSMKTSSAGNLYVLATAHIMSGDIPTGSHYVLFSFDSSGDLLNSWTILYQKYTAGTVYNSIPIMFNTNGLLYIGGYWLADGAFGTDILVYNPEEVDLPEITPQIDILLIVAIVALIIIVGAVYVLRRRI